MAGLSIRRGLLFFLCILFIVGTAEAAFITDKIMVEVRTERFGQGAVLKKLPSGTSVEVLMIDGQYTRIRTPNNITGWVNSTFITKEKPTQLEYLELLARSKATEAKLRSAEEKLASAPSGSSSNISDAEIEQLKNQAKDARWMKVEMQKARDRAEQAEAKLKATGKQRGDSKQELEKLRVQNEDLEKRLAAAILVNEQQAQEESETALPSIPVVSNQPEPIRTDDDNWDVSLKWFFGSLIVALIAGFVIGITWLDKRIRQRHGGFRIY